MWYRKLGRGTEHRLAMLRNMVTSLIYHERIMTTTPRAKELRRVAEKMITHAKTGTLHHRRLAAGFVREKAAVVKLFEILGPRYTERPGGYTRVLKLQKPRRGDSSDMAYIEFVDREGEMRKARPPPPPQINLNLVVDTPVVKTQKIKYSTLQKPSMPKKNVKNSKTSKTNSK